MEAKNAQEKLSENVLIDGTFDKEEALKKKEFRATQRNLLKEFLLTKKLEGCSMETIRDYHDKIVLFIDWAKKGLPEMHTKDIKSYLFNYKDTHKVFKP